MKESKKKRKKSSRKREVDIELAKLWIEKEKIEREQRKVALFLSHKNRKQSDLMVV